MVKEIFLDQNQETSASLVSGDHFYYRYAYSRSADTIKSNSTGQDALTIREEGARLVFVLCDGVSQSFYGNLASRFLSEEMNLWLWQNSDHLFDQYEVGDTLSGFLNKLTENASRIVSNQSLPEDISPLLRTVLEKKRGLGSESTFVAGCLDADRQQALFAWMGDSRLRIWSVEGEINQNKFGIDTFKTQERWSTCKGLIGELHCNKLKLDQIHHVMVYSDGLARLDTKIRKNSPSNQTLSQLITESGRLAASDDISYLEIWQGLSPDLPKTAPKAPSLLRIKIQPQKNLFIATWKKVNRADGYEIAIQHLNGWKLFNTKDTVWETELNSLPNNTNAICVRSWCNGNISEWSRTQPVTIPGYPERNSLSFNLNSGSLDEKNPVIQKSENFKSCKTYFKSKSRRPWFLPVLVLIEVGLICLASIVFLVWTNKINFPESWMPVFLHFNQSEPVQTTEPGFQDHQDHQMPSSATIASDQPTQTGSEIPRQVTLTPTIQPVTPIFSPGP